MSKLDLSSMTVAELRKMAREYGVTLGAGINKAGIIAKLDDAILDDDDAAPVDAPEQLRMMPEAPAEAPDAACDAPEDAEAPEARPAEEALTAPAAAPEQPQAPVQAAPVQPAPVQPAPAQPASAQATPAQPRSDAGQVQFRAAWHNPSPRYGSRPSYGPGGRNNDTGWGAAAPTPRPGGGDPSLRIGGTVRPANYTPRFGPAAQQESRGSDEYRAPSGYRPQQEAPRGGYGDRRAQYDQRAPYEQPQQRGYDRGYEQPQYPSYEQRPYQQPGFDQRGPYQQPSYGQPQSYDGFNRRPGYDQPRQGYQRREPGFYDAELGTSNPAVGELLASGECSDGSGILELHPDGYGFLRSDTTFLPSSKDIYVSMAQVKRFGLRNGDKVTGKTRPQREGDKYSAMLYITDVNGVSQDALGPRTSFDELTPSYPTRRINMEMPEGEEKCDVMRLVDLVAPMGFGHRGLVLCPPDTGKRELLRDYANTIAAANPDAQVMMLIIDETPEEVTLMREQCHCPVLASTFDMPPETHLRLADLVLERAERLAEQQKDVVLIVDSLTRLSKTFTAAAAQAGRTMPGMVNPSSLFRAKKLFGAARCLKEGGSLTVIGAMSIDGANKVDDAVVEEFRSTANSELVLDGSMARTGVRPPVNLQLSGTRRAEMLLTPEQQEGTSLMRGVLGTMQSSQAVPQLMSMMDKAATNDELLAKLKDWVALMKSGRPIG